MDWRKGDAKRRVFTKAEAQEGLVSLAQAVEAGVPERSVQRTAWLHPVTRGVYAVGHTNVSRRGLLWVAHLATGAPISHESAAWEWRLIPALTSPIHVTTAGSGRSRRGIHVHRGRPAVATRDGLPVVTVAEVLNRLPQPLLMRALREARYLGILQPQQLRGRAKRGWDRIKVVPAHRTRSEYEHWMLGICDSYDLPHPLVNERFAGEERDFYWPQFKLVAETDGGQHRWLDDAKRDRDLLARTGVRTIRFRGDEKPPEVAQTLTALFVS
jgi:hypothetical protein